MYVSPGTMDGSGRRPAWRDPVVFILLEALIEDGLGEVSQETIPQQRIRSAVKIYFLRHPYATAREPFAPPTPSYDSKEQKKSPLFQATGKIGGLTRVARQTPEQRQASAIKAINARWHNQPQPAHA